MSTGKQQVDAGTDAVKKTFRDHGGILRFVEARQLGINPPTLYRLRDHGVIQPIGRGLYRLAEGPPLTQPDLKNRGVAYWAAADPAPLSAPSRPCGASPTQR